MLLNSNQVEINRTYKSEDTFIAGLIGQSRYTEAYRLLKNEAADKTETQYNLALCFYWIGCYREALMSLDRAQRFMPVTAGKTNPAADNFYKALREKQNQLNDHHCPITQKHVEMTPQLVTDGIMRLKTDCWLQLEEYGEVINIATPMIYKNYSNVTSALAAAKKQINL